MTGSILALRALAPLEEKRFYLYGYGVANRAVALALVDSGREVVVSDDRGGAVLSQARSDGCETVAPASFDAVAEIVASVDAVIPTPGLSETHSVVTAALSMSTPILSEFDVAASLDGRPMVSITGTNGKTTVTMLTTAMLSAAGLRAVAVGNTEVPLVSAIGDPQTDVFVVEASSFRLSRTRTFKPNVATWLNFAPDHLDVHSSLETYENAKLRSWTDLDSSAVAVANSDDAVVAGHVGTGSARFVTFGVKPMGDHPHFLVRPTEVIDPQGEVIVGASELVRSLPHDLSNIAAAAATASFVGADRHAQRAGAIDFEQLPHRVESIVERHGVAWVNDSKATAPHATIAAASGYESVVLIAGGKNKGIDLSSLQTLTHRLRAVVGIGEAGPLITSLFENVPTALASSMKEAVSTAGAFAHAGDTVLLSPACASFDWYGSYGERGDDFRSEVLRLLEKP